MRYIAFLRGINVGGQKKIKMLDLKVMFEALNFINVKTYIQSGNVSFDYGTTDTIELSNVIEKKISETFGFLVKAIIRTEDELRNIVNNNPFTKQENIELDKVYITLMVDIPQPSTVSLLDMKKEENEKFIIISSEIYVYCPNGYGRTKLNNNMFEKKLKTDATTRGLKTLNNILGNM
ncbi:DUF1697 domain-containing protein [Clostridium sp. CF012]|uniref:DUF1697 domain-containing protein n=1 Tax=Clostridium sp. CF012 TaxID=2843319 RepID=UPI001C0B1685|nr:DUF1697 domain-containing protein [Clostridium sp. CF012]MBU3144922.1 DUF1697 domain-containing protein [Clostridium sp. CF012]